MQTANPQQQIDAPPPSSQAPNNVPNETAVQEPTTSVPPLQNNNPNPLPPLQAPLQTSQQPQQVQPAQLTQPPQPPTQAISSNFDQPVDQVQIEPQQVPPIQKAKRQKGTKAKGSKAKIPPIQNLQNIQNIQHVVQPPLQPLQNIPMQPFQQIPPSSQLSQQPPNPAGQPSSSAQQPSPVQAQQPNQQQINQQAVNVNPPGTPQHLIMPVFWHLLNDQDKDAYTRMRLALSSPACKHRRHHSNELNREIVNTIKNFVIRSDGDDWKRALVTGIVWLPNAIAINTRQLRLLLSKCKSSINALFQNLGYCTIPTTNDYSSSIIAVFPLLKDNFTELRKWTIRLYAPQQDKKAKTAKNENNNQANAIPNPTQDLNQNITQDLNQNENEIKLENSTPLQPQPQQEQVNEEIASALNNETIQQPEQEENTSKSEEINENQIAQENVQIETPIPPNLNEQNQQVPQQNEEGVNTAEAN